MSHFLTGLNGSEERQVGKLGLIFGIHDLAEPFWIMTKGVLFLLFVSILALAGCRHAATEADAHSRPSPASPDVLSPSVRQAPDWVPLVKGIAPGDQLSIGKWEVKLASDTGNLTVAKLTDSGSTTFGPQNWRASNGAFVCVESTERLWVYDGTVNLTLFQADAGSFGAFGPRQFPCAIPQIVAMRLSTDVYERVKPLGLGR